MQIKVRDTRCLRRLPLKQEKHVSSVEGMGAAFEVPFAACLKQEKHVSSLEASEGLTDDIHHILLFSGRLGCLFDRPDH